MRRKAIIKATCLLEEKKVLQMIAQQDRQRMAEVLRGLVRAEGKKRGLWAFGKS